MVLCLLTVKLVLCITLYKIFTSGINATNTLSQIRILLSSKVLLQFAAAEIVGEPYQSEELTIDLNPLSNSSKFMATFHTVLELYFHRVLQPEGTETSMAGFSLAI